MKKIITISREYGSGGREIGKMLAEKFGIPFYDKNVTTLSAIQSGLSETVVKQAEDQVPSGLKYRHYLQFRPDPIADKVFFAQSDVIREMASRGPCVIVGRCSDYVLRDNPQAMHLFIHASITNRIRRIMLYEQCTEHEARKRIRLIDRQRANYHDHYAQGGWGRASNYHLTIDSSFGIEKSAEIIIASIRLIDECI